MKKKLIAILLAGSMVALTACGGGDAGNTSAPSTDAPATDAQGADTADAPEAADTSDAATDAAATGELTDGKFAETRHITVEVYDRGNDGGTDPTNNMYTEYIKKGMLEDHNVEVEFVKVPRWTEVEEINNLLCRRNGS